MQLVTFILRDGEATQRHDRQLLSLLTSKLSSLSSWSGKLAVLTSDGIVHIRDRMSGKEVTCMIGQGTFGTSIAQLKDGRIACAGGDKIIRLFRANSDNVNNLVGHTRAVRNIIALTDGHLASCGYDKTVRVWNVNTGLCTTMTGHSDDVIQLLQINDTIVSASMDCTVRLWDLKSMTCLQTYTQHSFGLSLGYFPDGTLVCAGMMIYFWDIEVNLQTNKLSNNSHSAWKVIPYGFEQFLYAGTDKNVSVYDRYSNTTNIIIQGHLDTIWDMALLGDKLFTASEDCHVKIWSMNDYTMISDFTFKKPACALIVME